MNIFETNIHFCLINRILQLLQEKKRHKSQRNFSQTFLNNTIFLTVVRFALTKNKQGLLLLKNVLTFANNCSPI